ncbi:unnamed protein product [Plutella xylostella]|uniref:(diamondback moth) hypothetical protein n=1 Tax=Plutella xylostella TaxID=51655 RepID=A0A8S4F4S3_PLUXY|nr:unnamed protein product [Plutella xylostella]
MCIVNVALGLLFAVAIVYYLVLGFISRYQNVYDITMDMKSPSPVYLATYTEPTPRHEGSKFQSQHQAKG